MNKCHFSIMAFNQSTNHSDKLVMLPIITVLLFPPSESCQNAQVNHIRQQHINQAKTETSSSNEIMNLRFEH